MRLFRVFLMFLLFLTACTAPAPSTMAPANTSKAKSEDPILNGTFGTSLLVTEWKGSSEGNILFPLDPINHLALPDYPPISLGLTFFSSFSPDRQTLAVLSFPNDNTYNGSLLLIDLPEWKTKSFDLGLRGWVSNMVFSPDEKRLAIAHGETRYQLTLVDVETGIITAERPMDSFTSRLKFTEGGEALMLYSPSLQTEANGISSSPPQVMLLDTTDLSPRWSTELANVHDGVFPADETVKPTTLYESGNGFYLSPGLVFAPGKNLLYIAHADTDQLTTVDFDTRKVKTVEIENQLSWFERLLSLTAGTAHAKIANGTSKQVAVSPDGEFLYVIGVKNNSSQDQQGNWEYASTPLGLEVIQTNNGSRVDRIETNTTELSLSPDGRFLYLRNWGNNENNIPWTDVFDVATMQMIAHKTGLSGTPALLMNGEFLLVSTYSTSETSNQMSILKPDGSSVLAEWTAPGYAWWLNTP